jgi:hypothetical protein
MHVIYQFLQVLFPLLTLVQYLSELVNLPIYILPNFQLLDNDTSTGILSLALKINFRELEEFFAAQW